MTVPYVYRRRRWLRLFGAVDRLGGMVRRPVEGVPAWAGVRSILVLKLDQTGDLILTLPLLQALREAAPAARIEVAVGRDRRGVLEGIPGLDAVHELPIRLRVGETRNTIDFVGLARGVRTLRARRFDAVVAPKEEPLTVLLTALIGAPTRVGFREGGLGFLLTHFVPIGAPGPHQWEILASLAGSYGRHVGPPRFPMDDQSDAEASRLEARMRSGSTLPLVIVHTGAGKPTHKWSEVRFAEAVRLIAREVPCVIAYAAGPDEAPAEAAMHPGIEPPSRSTNLPPALPLGVFAALVTRAALLIGNDSAPAHLAAAVGTPAVVPFFSGNDPRRWGPCGAGHSIVEGPQGVGPEPQAVAEAALSILRRQLGGSVPPNSFPC